MKNSRRILLKQRNEYGYLVNRCNRCGQIITKDTRYYAGKEPICFMCFEKLKSKLPPYNRNKIRKVAVTKHREEFYDKAINKLIDGKGSVDYTKERWRKLKDIRG